MNVQIPDGFNAQPETLPVEDVAKGIITRRFRDLDGWDFTSREMDRLLSLGAAIRAGFYNDWRVR